MSKSEFGFIALSFVAWRLLLFGFLFAAVELLPLEKNFLGGGLGNYLQAPWLWAWANFDGEHYLAIAQMGYQPLTYFFFPLFPLTVRALGVLTNSSMVGLAVGGLVISNAGFFIALMGLWKLVKEEFNIQAARLAVVLFLVFPTSFFFGSYYTESLYLMLAVWSFYLVRKNHWLGGGLLGALAGSARIIGLALIPAYLAELWFAKGRSLAKLMAILLCGLGFLAYLYYVKVQTGDAFNFLNTVSIFGAQRSSSFVLLPQVLYRYFFKILPAVNFSYWPGAFASYLEIITGVAFLIFGLLAFVKMKLSYAVYTAVGYVIPTLSGSFSSFPRYALALFPAFILMALYLAKAPRLMQVIVFGTLLAVEAVATALFVRGYWIA